MYPDIWQDKQGKRRTSSEYRAWQALKNRCLNSHGQDWRYYGGRRITMDPSWTEFKTFLAEMGRRPNNSLTLERKDGNKPYCKSNCEWATRETQSRNRSYVKLTLEKANEIRRAYKSGMRQVALAQQYGVCQRTISLIVRGEGWRSEIGEEQCSVA